MSIKDNLTDQFTCNHCNSLIRVPIDNLTRFTETYYNRDDIFITYTTKCPFCNKNKVKIPKTITEKIDKLVLEKLPTDGIDYGIKYITLIIIIL